MTSDKDSSDGNQKSFPTPPNEEKRLRTLKEYNILHTPPEPAFDRLTRMASEIFEVPVVLITFLDEERQWFKSMHGFEKNQIARSESFCNQTLLEEDIVVIRDLKKHETFRNNPLVKGDPNYRFYAGAPIETDEGYILGTFCLLDTEPGDLSDRDMRILRLFALESFSQIELHQKNHQLEQTKNDFQALAEERQSLLQELNHRVKNNLNLVSSFLNIQRRHHDSDEINAALEDARDRIQAITSIHDTLDQEYNQIDVELRPYVTGFLKTLREAHEQPDQVINYQIDVENVKVPGNIAVSLCIIINELITNAFKYSLKDSGDTLRISFERLDDEYRLVVEDNGPGLPKDLDFDELETLGFKIVDKIAEGRLNGTFSHEPSEGARFVVTFPRDGI